MALATAMIVLLVGRETTPRPWQPPPPPPVQAQPVAEEPGLGCAPEPRTFEELNPPATRKEIAAAEAEMGVRFPDDLKASLLRHDGAESGMGSFFFVFRLSPVKELVSDWRTTCEAAMPEGAGGSDGVEEYVGPEGWWWHGSAIPFAKDSGGDNMVLDGKGRVDHFFVDGGLSFTDFWAWPSYLDFLEDVAHALESGEPLRKSAFEVTPEGDLEWTY